MRNLSTQDWLILGALVGAGALLVGALSEASSGWGVAAGLAVWSALQNRQRRRLQRWSLRPLGRPRPLLDSWQDIAERPYQRLRDERERSRRYLRRLRELVTLGEAIPDATLLVGPNGELEDFNEAAQSLLNLESGDRGLSLISVVRDPDFVGFVSPEAEESQIEFPSPYHLGRSLEARRFAAEEGRTIVLVRDITELNRLLTMRQDFIANVSHELRTPITVIAGYLEALEDPAESEETRLAIATRLRAPLGRMQSLVADLMLLARLESTPTTQDPEPVPLGALIERAVREVQGVAGAEYEFEVDIRSDRRVIGSEMELYSVCQNLLSNAIRYSPDGGVIRAVYSDSTRGVRLEVSDTGIGIAPEHIDRITERFYRVDMAGSRRSGGTGLGLAIVKHVLRRHDSLLGVTSQLGEGSRFWCDFEAVEPQDQALAGG
ncbi:MAG: phosphate regulon sensor histidine kinase PhoR [Pseudomonadota bacterium]